MEIGGKRMEKHNMKERKKVRYPVDLSTGSKFALVCGTENDQIAKNRKMM